MALDALGLVLAPRLHERVIYADTFAHGKTAFEIEPNGVAARELSDIWKALKARIHENEKDGRKERRKEEVAA